MITYYTVYRITNLINNKVYIGRHQTNNLDDNYMGSGVYIDKAKKKYGIESFTKEILFIFDNEDDMYSKEAELVTEEFVRLDTNYNKIPGGRYGGVLEHSAETKAKISKTKLGKPANRISGPSAETKAKISAKLKGHKRSKEAIAKQLETRKANGSRFHTEASKEKMRKPKAKRNDSVEL